MKLIDHKPRRVGDTRNWKRIKEADSYVATDQIFPFQNVGDGAVRTTGREGEIELRLEYIGNSSTNYDGDDAPEGDSEEEVVEAWKSLMMNWLRDKLPEMGGSRWLVVWKMIEAKLGLVSIPTPEVCLDSNTYPSVIINESRKVDVRGWALEFNETSRASEVINQAKLNGEVEWWLKMVDPWSVIWKRVVSKLIGGGSGGTSLEMAERR